MKNSSQEVSKTVKKKKQKKEVMEMQPKPTVFYGEKEEKRIFNLKDGFGE